MSRTLRRIAGFGLGWLATASAFAQGNTPPTVEIIRWDVTRFRNGVTETVYNRGVAGLNDRARIYDGTFGTRSYLHEERDVVRMVLEIIDGDWTTAGSGGQGDQQEQEEVSYSFFASAEPFRDYGPVPGSIVEATEDELVGRFRPAPGQTVLNLVLSFRVPEFIGKNQARLRGQIRWDARWFISIAVSNTEGEFPEDEPVFADSTSFVAIENPALLPPNAPAFADAGADQLVVVNSNVTLDASRTFDSYNLGFDTNNPNNFDKDTLTYAWEFVSGPLRIDPVQTNQNSPLATVLLTQSGEYVYRVTVDDNFNALPTSDVVTITVVDSIPANQPPVAQIAALGRSVVVGNSITLDGSGSSDPDGDTLTYRWTQTDELGGEIPLSELREVFQPLAGLTSSRSTWQALTPGTYYFRLLVSDGQLISVANTSVVVVAAATGGVTATADQNPLSDPAPQDDAEFGPPAPAMCGAAMMPLMLTPLLLAAVRRRT